MLGVRVGLLELGLCVGEILWDVNKYRLLILTTFHSIFNYNNQYSETAEHHIHKLSKPKQIK